MVQWCQTFVNSLQHSQLSLSLRQKGATTYTHLVDEVGGYAMAEEEQMAHGYYSELRLIVKFSIEEEVGVIKSSQDWARKANLTVYREKVEPDVMQIDSPGKKYVRVDKEETQVETPT
ncbi:hypothetical protein LWI28_000174 [Acer negundo]|uniref:Uncharacterized protein n=1 Tax=Acer negundo TaxID=4023 RepID=A0AAD5JBZ7_ACENE|nr:hypothetical protein LWI28_000174 [Acer negundo]